MAAFGFSFSGNEEQRIKFPFISLAICENNSFPHKENARPEPNSDINNFCDEKNVHSFGSKNNVGENVSRTVKEKLEDRLKLFSLDKREQFPLPTIMVKGQQGNTRFLSVLRSVHRVT